VSGDNALSESLDEPVSLTFNQCGHRHSPVDRGTWLAIWRTVLSYRIVRLELMKQAVVH
jgi:hypothetical protein